MKTVTSGVLVVHKPRGPTSHDVVAMARRAMRTREVGHAGTLDPMASGVLVVAVGEATKLVAYLTRAPKEYTARVELGRETDTLDALGKVTREAAVGDALLSALERPVSNLAPIVREAIARELARTSQEPPAFSAIQQDGERAYARARRGEVVSLPAREVRVHRLEVTATGRSPEPWVELSVRADKGYYVRSLARDLARSLGTVGMLSALERTDSGGFTLGEALTLPATQDELLERLIPLPVAARRALPAATLTGAGVVAARFGQRVPRAELTVTGPEGEPAAWFDEAGALVAIGVLEGDGGRVVRGFASSG